MMLFLFFQRVLRNKNEQERSTEEPTRNRKGSVFTDFMERNKKTAAPNPGVYTVPDGSSRPRKGSTFSDLLSRTKKPAAQQNGITRSSLKKPTTIMEEVEPERTFDAPQTVFRSY